MAKADASANAQRIGELEIRLAYQDKLLSELDDVVQNFALRVERLERQISELRDNVSTQEIGPGDDKPPHY